ncbi:protein of unknown function [Streptomyces murinus]
MDTETNAHNYGRSPARPSIELQCGASPAPGGPVRHPVSGRMEQACWWHDGSGGGAGRTPGPAEGPTEGCDQLWPFRCP